MDKQPDLSLLESESAVLSSVTSVPDPSVDDLESLLVAARDATSPDERRAIEDVVVRRHLSLTHQMARRYQGRGADLDDLVAVANLGLLKAVRGFDPSRGVFERYARRTIAGDLKKHFRDHCWMIRPPRQVQDLQREISRLLSEQESAQQDLTPRQVAEALGVDIGLVVEAMALRDHFTARSLDQPSFEGSTLALQDSVVDPVDEVGRLEARMELRDVLDVLDPQDQELLALRFVLELTQEQIARRVGVSQVQVSRRLRRVLDQVRTAAAAA